MSCLLCVSFLDRSGVVASIQLDSVLVENAEYETSASESAGSPDFIYRMSGNIEVHYSLFSVELLRLAGRNRRQRHNHLLLQLDYMLCRFPECKDFVGQGTNHYQYVRWLGFRKQDVVGVNPVVDADDANDLYPAERLLSHAKVGEDVLKCFLGGDALFTRDFCKVVDDDAEIFGKEVAT
jgi:hypothetical protein